jgi:hypothetical protein
MPIMLTLAYSEHLCAAGRACALSSRLAVLHSYALRVFHFLFSPALHTVCLHLVYLLFVTFVLKDRTLLAQMSIVLLKHYLPESINYQSIYI